MKRLVARLRRWLLVGDTRDLASIDAYRARVARRTGVQR